jgi:hypothetical protein
MDQNVRTTDDVTFGNVTVAGSGKGLYFTGGNNRVYFAGNRAFEGNGTTLQIGEGHSLTQLQSSTATYLYNGSVGNSPPLVFGNETGASKKAIYLESYWMVYQGHQNEGHKFRTTDASGNLTDRFTITTSGATSNIGLNTGAFYLSDSNAGLYRDNTYDVILLQANSSGNPLYMAGAGEVRISIDSNNNETAQKFIVGNNAIKSTNELFSVNESGTAFASSDFRAPIFYDSDDTTYRIDGLGTSVLNALTTNGIFRANGTGAPFMRWHNTTASGYMLLGMYDDNGSQKVWFGMAGRTQTFGSYAAYSTDGLSMNLDGSGAINISNRGSSKRINLNTGAESSTNFTTLRLDNQNVSITPDSNTGTLDAPIFRELTSTGYYLDPSSTGTSLSINGGIVTTAPGGSILMKHAVSEVDAWIFQENAANWGLYWKNNPSGHHAFGAYTTVGAELVGMSAANVSGRGVLTSNFVGASSAYAQWMLSNYTGYIWSASTIDAAGDMRSPIYYDRDNTGFRIDPTDYSYVRYLKVRSSGTSSGTRALTIHDESQSEINFGSYPGAWTSALQIQSNNNATYLWISPLTSNNGRIYMAGAGLEIFTESNALSGQFFSGQFRTGFIYDFNDTTYYLDPNGSTSGIFRGMLRIGGGGYGGGNYNENIRLVDATNGFSVIVFGASGDTGPGRYQWLKNSSDNFELRPISQSTVWYWDQSGIAYSNVQVRAPIFYDQNNTGYYVDPNSSSRLRGPVDIDDGHGGTRIRLTANGSEMGTGVPSYLQMWVSEPGVTWNDAGFGFNVHNDGGSPAGFGRINGGQGQAYMRFNTGGNTYFYNTNTSGTRYSTMEWYSNGTVYANDYLTGGNSLRAPIFYDSNDTGYYVNPNGQSQFSYVMANDWFRPQGCTGVYWNSYGRGMWMPECEGNPYGNITTYAGGRNGWQGWGIQSRYTFMSTGGDNCGVHDSARGWIWYMSGAELNLYWAGSRRAVTTSWGTYFDGYTEAGGSVRGPIFYDNQDTGYYLDPHNTDNQGLRIRGGTLHGPNWSWGAYLRVGTNGYLDGWAHVMTTNGNLHLDCRAGYETYINHYTGNRTYTYELRSTFIYDYNNTGYYMDPNGTSRMNYVIHDNVYSYSWIFSQNNIIAYYSDERLKTNLGPIENPLDKVHQLNGFYYIENDLARSFGYTDEKVQVGLSAQQVQAVLPQVVTLAPFDMDIDEDTREIKGSKTGENYLTVDYEKIVPLLVEAIKELSDDLNKTKEEVKELRKLIEEK